MEKIGLLSVLWIQKFKEMWLIAFLLFPILSIAQPVVSGVTHPGPCNAIDGSINISGAEPNQPYIIYYKKNGTPLPGAYIEVSDGGGNLIINGDTNIVNFFPFFVTGKGVYSDIQISDGVTVSNFPGPHTLIDPGSADTSVYQNNNTLTAVSGATYQWLNCGNSYAPILGEVNQSFTTIQSGEYAVQVSQNGCVDTSPCHSVVVPSMIEVANFIPNNSAFAKHILWTGTTDIQPSTIKICADGSTATKLKFINNSKLNHTDIEFIISSDPNYSNIDSCGQFINYSVSGNTIYATLEHPKFIAYHFGLFRRDTIKVVNKNNFSDVLFTIPVHIYRAPVLMVHGLWGNIDGKSGAFSAMENSFIQDGFYLKQQLLRANYRTTNSCGFKQNEKVIPNHISSLLKGLINDGFSVGKVDLVCHSMGGLLARQYIQGPYFSFRNDVHRFISMNVPHSGSQVANLALTNDPDLKEKVEAANFALTSVYFLRGHKCNFIGDALQDLRVNSPTIRNLNFTTINNGKVPTHAITSEEQFSISVDKDASETTILAAAATVVATDLFLDKLFFNDKHDLIVSQESQTGGLQCCTTHYKNIYHSAIKEKTTVVQHVKQLLSKNSKDAQYYSQDWYNPVDLSGRTHYKPNVNQQESSLSRKGYMNVTTTNSSFDPGSNIVFDYNSSNGIVKVLMIAVTSNGHLYSQETTQTSGTMHYTIPNDVFGKAAIVFIGYGSNSEYVDFDTISFDVKVNAALDSMTFYPDTAYIQVGEDISLGVMGYFGNGYQFDISFATGVNFAVVDPLIAQATGINNFIGIDTGVTLVKVDFLGKSISIPLVIIPRDTNLPLKINERSDKAFVDRERLSVYPNPTTGEFTVEINSINPGPVLIQIFDRVGNKIIDWDGYSNLGNYKKIFSLRNAIAGIYYIKAITKDRIYNSQVLLLK